MGVITNGSGGGGGNVRYNPDTDMVEAKYNGTWTPFYNAGIQAPVSLVPVLTGDDSRIVAYQVSGTPSTNAPAWHCFDEKDTLAYIQNTHYFGFDFQRDVYVSSLYTLSQSGGSGGDRYIVLQYSDDATTWYDASPVVGCGGGSYEGTVASTVLTAHRYWRVYCSGAQGYFRTVRFMGRGA